MNRDPRASTTTDLLRACFEAAWDALTPYEQQLVRADFVTLNETATTYTNRIGRAEKLRGYVDYLILLDAALAENDAYIEARQRAQKVIS